ncbi:hypothetical protein [Halomonas icarae]|uniref:Uncharacterized protein n=1 Tax=Halomonas icarae TaxID=2691040 RepID=A0A7X5AJI1_9GAMM|nr:hypothetical protein [Halomonas icarae]MDR5901036.1 hypothetical protein [Halomonas icarae]NAW11312.1 hypothetical protein [Halomonas icarae]
MAYDLEERDIDAITESVLITWRDALDHDLAALRDLEAETRQLSRDGYSLGPEGAGAIADLLANVADSLTQTRMEIYHLAHAAGEDDEEALN